MKNSTGVEISKELYDFAINESKFTQEEIDKFDEHTVMLLEDCYQTYCDLKRGKLDKEEVIMEDFENMSDYGEGDDIMKQNIDA